jgi:type 1 glutamine amidotransferase
MSVARTALFIAAAAAVSVPLLAAPAKVLVVTVTKGFRHESIPTAERVLQGLAEKSGAFTLDYARNDAELAAKAAPKALESYAGAVFASTSGDIPLPDREGFLAWIAGGRAFVGIHAASDTFPGFPPYIDMIGGQFKKHGPQTTVELVVKDTGHPSTRELPRTLSVFDEIYQFQRYDPARVHLLLTIAKHPETGEAGEFPLAWTRAHEKGKVFYTALGHRDDVLEADWFKAHLLGGILWALGR